MKGDGLYSEFGYKKISMLLFSPDHSNTWRPRKLRAQWCQLCGTHTLSKIPIEIDETQNSSVSMIQNHQELSTNPRVLITVHRCGSTMQNLACMQKAQGIGIFPVNMTQEWTYAQHLYRQNCGWAFRYSLQEIAHRLCLLPELGAVQRATEREEISLCSWRRGSGTPPPLHCCWSHAVRKMGCAVHATVTSSFQE